MKKSMLKTVAIFIVTIVIFFTCVYFVISTLVEGGKRNQNIYKIQVGKKVVYEKDTCTIVDYSMIEETFTLSNGKKVSKVLIPVLPVIK